ncbi:MAG: hypothetical protein ACLQU4_19115 [Limisphaerales bacterium]
MTGLAKNTVLNVLNTAGEHCERFLADHIKNVKATSVQVDELFSYVGRSAQFVEPDDPERGAFYCYLSVDRQTKLIINHFVGKRRTDDCLVFMQELKARTNGERFQLTSDGFPGYIGYAGAVFQTFKHEVDYGTEVKHFAKEFGALSAFTKAPKKYNRTIVDWVKRVPQIGKPKKKWINTSHAERLNLTMRLFNRRFTRCTLGYSKKIENHKHSTALFVCLYNFCRVHSAHGQTPAQAAGLTDHLWTVAELLNWRETDLS